METRVTTRNKFLWWERRKEWIEMNPHKKKTSRVSKIDKKKIIFLFPSLKKIIRSTVKEAKAVTKRE